MITRKLLVALCAGGLISGTLPMDVQAVPLAELVATHGSITGGNLRFENFTATLSTQGLASPMDLSHIDVGASSGRLFGNNPGPPPGTRPQGSLGFSGPFTADSGPVGPSPGPIPTGSVLLQVDYDVVGISPTEGFDVLTIGSDCFTTGTVPGGSTGPSAGCLATGPGGSAPPSRFNGGGRDTMVLPGAITQGHFQTTINVFAGPQRGITIPQRRTAQSGGVSNR